MSKWVKDIEQDNMNYVRDVEELKYDDSLSYEERQNNVESNLKSLESLYDNLDMSNWKSNFNETIFSLEGKLNKQAYIEPILLKDENEFNLLMKYLTFQHFGVWISKGDFNTREFVIDFFELYDRELFMDMFYDENCEERGNDKEALNLLEDVISNNIEKIENNTIDIIILETQKNFYIKEWHLINMD